MKSLLFILFLFISIFIEAQENTSPSIFIRDVSYLSTNITHRSYYTNNGFVRITITNVIRIPAFSFSYSNLYPHHEYKIFSSTNFITWRPMYSFTVSTNVSPTNILIHGAYMTGGPSYNFFRMQKK